MFLKIQWDKIRPFITVSDYSIKYYLKETTDVW